MIPFGWIGNALLIAGSWNLARKRRHAFLLTIGGCACWFYEATKMGRWDWLFIEAVMLLIAVRNYWYWGRTKGQ